MDTVLNQLKSQENQKKEKVSVIKVIYRVYHFIAKIFLYALLLILILIAILFIAYFIDMQRNLKNGTNKQPLFGAYIIISPSMVPTINVSDAIVIQRKEKDELKVGDIITFTSSDPRYSGLTITHRIVGIEKSKDGKFYFRTKGDNNNAEDAALVDYDNISGKVIFRIPKIGYIQQLLTRSYGWVIVVVVPCLGIVIYDILKIFKSLIKKTREINKNDDKDEYVEMIGEEKEESSVVEFIIGKKEEEVEIEKEQNEDIEIL